MTIFIRANYSDETQQMTKRFSTILGVFTSPNTTYNRLKSKERENNEEIDCVPVVSCLTSGMYLY